MPIPLGSAAPRRKQLISKEINRAENKYMNICFPPVIDRLASLSVNFLSILCHRHLYIYEFIGDEFIWI